MNPDNLSLSDISQTIGVSLSTVSNWQKRYEDFPQPVQGSTRRRAYRLADIKAFIARHDLQIKKQRSKERFVISATADLLRGQGQYPMNLEIAVVVATFAAMWSSERFLLNEIARSGKIPPQMWSIHIRLQSGKRKLDELYQEKSLLENITEENFQKIGELWLEQTGDPSKESRKRMCQELFELAKSSSGNFNLNSTSQSLAQLINKIGRGFKVLDISTGMGAILDTYTNDDCSLWGQDISLLSIHFQLLLNVIKGLPSHKCDLTVQDSLRHFEEKWVNAFDVVICDPPFGRKNVVEIYKESDPRWSYFEQTNKHSEMDYWIQTVLAYLRPSDDEKPSFRGILVAHDSWLFIAAEQAMRTALIRRGHIEAVIRLGDGLATGTSISLNLIIFRKTESPGASVRVIDASDVGSIARGRRTLSKNDIDNIVALLNNDFGEKSNDSSSEIFCKDVSLDELLENNAVLLPRRYRPVEPTKQDPLLVLKDVEVLLQTLEKKLTTLSRSLKLDKIKNEIKFISEVKNADIQIVNVGDATTNTAPFEILFKNRPQGTEWTNDEVFNTDIVICLIGPQIGESMMGHHFVSSHSNWSRIAQLRIKGDQLSREYFRAWLSNGNFRAQVDRLSGGTVLRAISKQDLNRIIVPIPNIEIQQLLGSIAGQIEALNRATKDVAELNAEMSLRLQTLLAVLISAVVTAHNRDSNAP